VTASQTIREGSGAPTLELVTLTRPDAVEHLPVEEWDALVEALPHPSPYLLQGWIVAELHGALETCEPRIHVARRSGSLVGALPLVISRTHGLRVAGFAGGAHTVWGDVLLAPGEPAATARELVSLAAHSDQDYCRFHGLAPDSRLGAVANLALVERTHAAGFDLLPGWDDVYRCKVSKRHRQSHRQKRRALAELGPLETRVARTPDELEAVLDDTFRLHELRWNGRYDSYGYAAPASRRLMHEVVSRLGAREQYRIVTLELGGRSIAFLSFFVVGDVAVGHRTAFDPVHARYSPGALVFFDGFAEMAAAGLRRFEFGGGDEQFKRSFADEISPLDDGFGLATTRRGSLAAAAAPPGTRLRRRLKRRRSLRGAYRRARALTSHRR
jgi:CelD/BcsL family acetyltransferase involved in cellulose biosynthesis